jgi:hypothetical protein
MKDQNYLDWGQVSQTYDEIKALTIQKELDNTSEAQTRFDVIDRLVREILQWKHGQISVEEYSAGEKQEYIDYLLRSGDNKIIIEAKKIGASFPTPTKKKKLKLTGSILSEGEIGKAITQAEKYAKTKEANLVAVTNGTCWCFYPFDPTVDKDYIYAYLLFPFNDVKDAETLFDIFAIQNVENDSLSKLTYENPDMIVRSLVRSTVNADARIERNIIADYISPALDYAFHGESLIGDKSKLEYCFVRTDARTKYDNTLKIFLSDKKSDLISPARRLKKQTHEDELQSSLKFFDTSKNVPVTLLIGSVGSGKSTYLSHFELIQAQSLLEEKKCFWVTIDFEKMGKSGSPRKFIYESLREFTLNEHPYVKTDFKSLIEPAYEEEIKKLARGPFGLVAKNKEKFEEKVQEIIEFDFENIEPYVNKIFAYISQKHLCVIVLDNIDLYEDSQLEIDVFSEGVAISKKINCNILVSLRDTTFIKHKNDSIFNAHELKKFWIDPPPFREVLSKRLKFASSVLANKKATIPYNGMQLTIENLGVFFDIAHSTLLKEPSARLIECLADGNIRKGISLVSNFLTSAHIQADRALYNYLNKAVVRGLPFHEVFKGSILGPWKYYKEERAEAINIFDSGFNARSLQLLRAYILKFLFYRAKDKNSNEVSLVKIHETFSVLGASENHIIKVVGDLHQNALINSATSKEIDLGSTVSINLSGAYYYSFLLRTFEYLETIMFDTQILIEEYWDKLLPLNEEAEYEDNIYQRILKRKERILLFLSYLKRIEQEGINQTNLALYSVTKEIEISLNRSLRIIVGNARKWYS